MHALHIIWCPHLCAECLISQDTLARAILCSEGAVAIIISNLFDALFEGSTDTLEGRERARQLREAIARFYYLVGQMSGFSWKLALIEDPDLNAYKRAEQLISGGSLPAMNSLLFHAVGFYDALRAEQVPVQILTPKRALYAGLPVNDIVEIPPV